MKPLKIIRALKRLADVYLVPAICTVCTEKLRKKDAKIKCADCTAGLADNIVYRVGSDSE